MKFKRLSALLLLLSLTLSVFLLSSCNTVKNREYSEDEVVAASKKLLLSSEVLNTVIFGGGIDYVDSGYRNGDYYEADIMHLSRLGFSTIAELEALARRTYTESYANSILPMVLEPLYDDKGNIRNTVRYYQAFDDYSGLEPSRIMVYSRYEKSRIIFDDRMTFSYDSIRSEGSTGDVVNMKVEVTVKSEDGKSQTRDIGFKLIEEGEGKWRLMGPVFANYNKYLEENK